MIIYSVCWIRCQTPPPLTNQLLPGSYA
jgi:hypothetical protein